LVTTLQVPDCSGADGGSGSGTFSLFASSFSRTREILCGNNRTFTLSMRSARHTSVILLRTNHLGHFRPAADSARKTHYPALQVVHCVPFWEGRENLLQFERFDEAYLERLRAGDPPTHTHFCAYFSRLIQIKLRSRVPTRDDLEEVRQETFKRFFEALQAGSIRQPERLGSFVNSMCNNVLREHRRNFDVNLTSLDDGEDSTLPPSQNIDPLAGLTIKEVQQLVREVLGRLGERDRRILREVFLEERDKDEVCRDFGVTREHLRLLVHRAKKAFRKDYEKRSA
jgi:RNA polymerase sigma-70 factor, ECF subfamily